MNSSMAIIEQEPASEPARLTAAVIAAVAEQQRVAAEARWRVWGGVLLRVVLLALCGYVLYRVRTIVTTLIVAGVLASAVSALVAPLTNVHVAGLKPKPQRLLATLFVFVALIAGLFITGHFLLRPFQVEWIQLRANWPHYQTVIQTFAVQAKVWFNGLSPDIRGMLNGMREKQPLPSLTTWLGGVLGATLSWASHVVELILIPVLAFYFVVDGRALRSELLFFIPRERLRSTMAILNESSSIMRAYVVAQFWLAVIAGITVGVGLSILGMPYAIILGVIAGVTRAIPVIGPLLGGIPVVALSFLYGAQQHNPFLWVGVLTFFTILHLLESKIIMPFFLGKSLRLHAVVILVALLIGGEFFGLMGMFLAAPLAALVRQLVMHFIIIPRRRRERAARLAADPLARARSSFRITTLEIADGGRGALRIERALEAERTTRTTRERTGSIV